MLIVNSTTVPMLRAMKVQKTVERTVGVKKLASHAAATSPLAAAAIAAAAGLLSLSRRQLSEPQLYDD
jgi:hypothetical protein